jgi:hypothetical protein
VRLFHGDSAAAVQRPIEFPQVAMVLLAHHNVPWCAQDFAAIAHAATLKSRVPFLHFFEGMMSLGPYRVPDSGRKMEKIWTDVPEAVSKFQLGHRYRLPLWELVYHDCTVSYWYWGDYNNKLPALWPKRDLFNVLYGTPPMYMFTKFLWTSERANFVKSYRVASEAARLTGYSEMVDNRFLTPDRDVQQTVFANGVKVTVNFGNEPYQLEGKALNAMSVRIDR